MDTRELLEAVDLVALAEEAGARFSARLSSTCPLHQGSDNRTAFHVYQARDGLWRWHCFTRCPEGENDGDAISFWMRWRGVEFKEAVRELSARAGVDPEVGGWKPVRYRKPDRLETVLTPVAEAPGELWQERARAFVGYARRELWDGVGTAVLDYLRRERGLNQDTAREWGLGYNPQDWWDEPGRWGLEGQERIWLPAGLVIPGERGEALWYVKVRRPLPGDALARAIGTVRRLEGVKFCGPRGGRACLFGTDRMARLPVLLLAEGEFDAMLLWQAAGDLADVVSLGGAKHRLDAADVARLAGAWSILAVYDVDAAGAAGAEYLRSVSERVEVVTVPESSTGTSPSDVTAFWQAGGNVRQWVGELVAGRMEALVGALDAGQNGDLRRRWLEVWALAEAAEGSDK